MAIDKKWVNEFVNVTAKAALASSYFIGKNDKIAADKAAVDSMRNELNKMNIKGKIVIGEGELDKAPMLYIGEELGNGNGPELDIAVDPLEGTNFAANNLPGALSVIAISEKNKLFNAPETYMEKISTLYFGLVTSKAPDTSPSVINLILTFSFVSSFIIFLCLGLSKIHAVKLFGFLLRYSLKLKIFFSIE